MTGGARYACDLRNKARALFHTMTSPNCPICFGIGFVCENHPDRAWSEELGCQSAPVSGARAIDQTISSKALKRRT